MSFKKRKLKKLLMTQKQPRSYIKKRDLFMFKEPKNLKTLIANICIKPLRKERKALNQSIFSKDFFLLFLFILACFFLFLSILCSCDKKIFLLGFWKIWWHFLWYFLIYAYKGLVNCSYCWYFYPVKYYVYQVISKRDFLNT